jgi:DNA polymerase V
VDSTTLQLADKKIGILDCNNFYVSCERAFNPCSIGKPTVVLSNNDGCVIARSLEAKDLGIKMGEVFFKKKEFMEEKGFFIYSSNYKLYGDMSDRVMNVIKKYVENIEVYSIDECFLDLSVVAQSEILPFLHRLKQEVYKQTSIPVSIGVGPNKTLAKLTASIAKKNPAAQGLCLYWDYIEQLDEIAVEQVWGIGRKWSKKLGGVGVTTIGQFIKLPDSVVRKLTTINGLRTKYELQGLYCHELKQQAQQKKNIATTQSFGTEIADFDELAAALYFFLLKGIEKLKSNRVLAQACTIFIVGNRFKGGHHYYSKQLTFLKQTRDIELIWSQIYPSLKKIYDKSKTYKKCGVIFNRLTSDKAVQLNLFTPVVQKIKPPVSKDKKWQLKKEYITPAYTSSWNDIPEIFI